MYVPTRYFSCGVVPIGKYRARTAEAVPVSLFRRRRPYAAPAETVPYAVRIVIPTKTA